MAYDMSTLTTDGSFINMVKWTNDALAGLFIPGLLIALYIIILLAFSATSFNLKAVMLVDSFFITILALISFLIGWVSWTVLLLPIMLIFVALGTMMFSAS